ncbi:MAG: NAD(P)/FAD-dependent oxidoreductase [Candidatus Methanoplasma sp.]|jgi:geranylgeranyl reductase family protein|nr:NAD(P)/FAD-dependent oxidoreductase [Candidatus Methanoplasma sp.]
MRDAVVVGAGPAGTRAAALLARDGRDALVIEARERPGRPVQCAGLISPETAEMSGVRPDALGEVTGADVHFPGGGCYRIRRDRVMAIAVDRAELDSDMADAAAAAGAEICCGERYLGHSVSGGAAAVRSQSREISARIVVGADGQGSAVAASLGDNGPREYLRGIQVDVRQKPRESGVMSMWLGSEVAPGFFGWEIPIGDMVRVGLCVAPGSPPPCEYLGPLLRRAGLDGREIAAKYSGKIPLGGRRATYGDGVLLIGDAAGQVKPVSGGGLFPAFKAAPILADVAGSALDSGRLSASGLSEYERRWKRELGGEMRAGYAIRRAFKRMSDAGLDGMLPVLEARGARRAMAEIEIDRPSRAMLAVLRDPVALARAAPAVLRALI